LYSHLRFVIAASLIAFGSVIAVGMPALLLSVDRPLVTRADVSDPPASSSCKQHGWLHFDRNCLSRRDLPWVAGRGGADAAMTEAPTEPNGQSAEPSLTENRQAATIHHEPVPPDSVPELFMPQVSVPQNLTLQEPASREAPPQQISPQAGTPAESVSNDTAPQTSAAQEAAPQETAPPEPALRKSVAEQPVRQREVAAPVRATPAQRPATEERHVAQPTTGAQPRTPVAKRTARRDRTAKPPANEALNAVRKFGDGRPEIPADSYAADGTRRKIVVRPTSIQDVYYYSRGSTSP
jgi:hypothetical protein